jgi:hypothetical protein
VKRLARAATIASCAAASLVLAVASADDRPAAPKPAHPDGGPIGSIPADPPPMREHVQWVFDLRYDKGDVYLLGVTRTDLGAPRETPRAMGRFALELFEGPALIERARFDFPLLGAAPPASDGGYRTPPSFDAKLVTRVGVMFPATRKGTRLELWDRATDRRWDLGWPPSPTAPTQARDGG